MKSDPTAIDKVSPGKFSKEFVNSGLDFNMKTLLIYALNPEAGILKQHFPKASKTISQQGVELLALNENYDLLRTGIGMERTKDALKHILDPQFYNLLIHFGVSGSLTEKIAVRSLICGNRFTAEDQANIELDIPKQISLPNANRVTFYSSIQVVADEASRDRAASHGAHAVDMESYPVAEFCNTHHLPLLALRIISDRAGQSTPTEFRKNFKQASEELQNYILNNILGG